MPILIVVGMNSEARIARSMGRVVVGARRLAPALIDDVTGVLSFGMCGALNPALSPGDLVIGTGVDTQDGWSAVDQAWLRRLIGAFPRAVVGAVAGVDAIVADARAKTALHATTGAIAADMESHEAAATAYRAGLPFAILRAVSDGAGDSLPLSAQAGFRPDGRTDVGAVIRGVISRPGELPALIRTARGAGRAMAALAGAADRLAAAT